MGEQVDPLDLKSGFRKRVPVRLRLEVHNGDLVQLARTLDLHSRGREFESHILHKKKGSKAVMMSLWGKGLKKGQQ